MNAEHIATLQRLEDGTPLLDLLRPEEEVALGIAIEVGVLAAQRLEAGITDPQLHHDLTVLRREGEQAFERFVLANVRLSSWLARRRRVAGATGGLTVSELTEEGMVGLIRAVMKWDFTRGLKFSTYALNWVKNFQARAVMKARSALSASWEDLERLDEVRSARSRLFNAYGRTPTEQELADSLGTTVRALRELLVLEAPTYCLDSPAGRDRDSQGSTIGERVSDGHARPEETVISADLGDRVRGMLHRLTPRERNVLVLRFGLLGEEPHTVAEVAAALRVPEPLVAGLLDRVLERLAEDSNVIPLAEFLVAA